MFLPSPIEGFYCCRIIKFQTIQCIGKYTHQLKIWFIKIFKYESQYEQCKFSNKKKGKLLISNCTIDVLQIDHEL